MMQMAASSKYIFYFCNVKSEERHEVAARKQRFLCPNLLVDNKRKRMEWGSSNAPKVSALDNLTAPCAAFFNVKFQVL